MRILMGIPFLYPAISYGGAARAAYELAESLQQCGHEVTVLTTDVWDSRSRYRQNGFHAPFEIIRVPNISNTLAYYCQFYTPLGILKYAERLLARSDVLHLHTFRNIPNDLLARTSVKQGIPYVLSGHGTIPRIERFFLIKKFYDLFIGHWQLQNATGYIAVSQAERKAMRRFGLPADKIRVIPNGVSPVARPERGGFRRRLGIKPEEKMILFLGKITPRKGLHHLVRAFATLEKNTRLVIAGNDMGYSGKIRNLVSELNLQDRVLWTGLLDDTVKFQALRDADVTVYPSVNEAFGLVPLESILAGTPVIVCNDGGCAQIIRKTGGGDFVPWSDVQALSFAIRRRLKDGKDRVELAAARKMIRRHFNWCLIAPRVLKFYDACLSGQMNAVSISS
jgi:glycosyltransferase involved in cell wall biosynthesis